MAYARSVPYFRLTDRADFLGAALAGLGQKHYLSGDHASARDALDEALAWHRQTDDPTWSTGALIWQGHLARADGDETLAVQLFTECLTAAETVHFELAVLEAVAGLACVALDLGQAARAARLLGAVAARQEATNASPEVMNDASVKQVVTVARDWLGNDVFASAFEEGRGIPWADAVTDAVAVLERKHAAPALQPKRRQTDPFALTRREREILDLLCQRFTDPEIAERLTISPRTASRHVANIFNKLGVSSRRDAAALAVAQGLL